MIMKDLFKAFLCLVFVFGVYYLALLIVAGIVLLGGHLTI